MRAWCCEDLQIRVSPRRRQPYDNFSWTFPRSAAQPRAPRL